MTARMAAVGGHLAVRSAPGEGTCVEGWVPLDEPDTAPSAPGVVPAPSPLDQVRVLVRQARDLYHGTAYAQSLGSLIRRLGEPPTIAVVGPAPDVVEHVRTRLDEALHDPGPRRDRAGRSGRRGAAFQETAVLVPAPCLGPPPPAGPVPPEQHLAPDPAAPDTRALDTPVLSTPAPDTLAPEPLAPPGADAVVLLVPSTAREEGCFPALLAATARLHPSQVLGVLVPGQPAGNEGGVEVPARLRRSCVTVLPAADAAAGSNGHGQEVYAELGRLVQTRLEVRLEALRARAALEALATLLRRSPPPRDGDRLRYELDRFRLGWHELVELDLLDQLAEAGPGLPPADRLAAERLLGLHGTDPAARLGCGPDADPGQLAGAAREHLTHWQQVAAHPASPAGTRTVARSLVGACERLLTTTAGREGPVPGGVPAGARLGPAPLPAAQQPREPVGGPPGDTLSSPR